MEVVYEGISRCGRGRGQGMRHAGVHRGLSGLVMVLRGLLRLGLGSGSGLGSGLGPIARMGSIIIRVRATVRQSKINRAGTSSLVRGGGKLSLRHRSG